MTEKRTEQEFVKLSVKSDRGRFRTDRVRRDNPLVLCFDDVSRSVQNRTGLKELARHKSLHREHVNRSTCRIVYFELFRTIQNILPSLVDLHKLKRPSTDMREKTNKNNRQRTNTIKKCKINKFLSYLKSQNKHSRFLIEPEVLLLQVNGLYTSKKLNGNEVKPEDVIVRSARVVETDH